MALAGDLAVTAPFAWVEPLAHRKNASLASLDLRQRHLRRLRSLMHWLAYDGPRQPSQGTGIVPVTMAAIVLARASQARQARQPAPESELPLT